MLSALAVFIGGGLGSILRWITCILIPSHWGTMCVNLLGALIIGMAYQYFSGLESVNPKVKLFVMTGLLGGFTTFSTYLLNFITLYNGEQKLEAVFFLISSIIIGCVVLLLGMELVKHL